MLPLPPRSPQPLNIDVALGKRSLAPYEIVPVASDNPHCMQVRTRHALNL